MEKITILKITGLGLSFTILLLVVRCFGIRTRGLLPTACVTLQIKGICTILFFLGCVSTVLLFRAGQSGVDYLFPSQQQKENARRRNPSASWKGVFMQYGWFAGFIYMLPGAAGLISSLYHYKYLRIIHLILSLLMIILGSFIHTILGITILLYRLFVVYGAVRHNASLAECIYASHLSVGYEEEACQTGRKALTRTIDAARLMFLCWIFILFDLLFRALTFSNSQIIYWFKRLGKWYSRGHRMVISDAARTSYKRIDYSVCEQQQQSGVSVFLKTDLKTE